MPWKAARALRPDEIDEPTPCWWSKPEANMSTFETWAWEAWQRDHPREPPSTALFDACFRIQREASTAAGRHIPMIVENVRSAQRWVGRARGAYGSFLLWGDVPALLPKPPRATKNNGGSWFAVAHNTTSGKSQNARDQAIKHGGDCFSDPSVKHSASGPHWFDSGPASLSSKSPSRKQASAQIAKIPTALSRFIGAHFHP